MYKTIAYRISDGLATITISRPNALNAINTEVLDELMDVFASISVDDTVKAVIITGKGKSFIAGADISQMKDFGPEDARAFTESGHRLMFTIESIPKVVIAAINGYALGGGCELALACDIRLASENAKFGMPEVNLGILPGFGGTLRLPKLVGKGMAKYLILTAEMIDAKEAKEIGLIEKVVPAEELMHEAERIARLIMSKAPVAVKEAKIAIDAEYDIDIKAGSKIEMQSLAHCFETEDQTEGMNAFLEKRPPKYKNK